MRNRGIPLQFLLDINYLTMGFYGHTTEPHGVPMEYPWVYSNHTMEWQKKQENPMGDFLPGLGFLLLHLLSKHCMFIDSIVRVCC